MLLLHIMYVVKCKRYYFNFFTISPNLKHVRTLLLILRQNKNDKINVFHTWVVLLRGIFNFQSIFLMCQIWNELVN